MTRTRWIPAVLMFGTAMLISQPAHANAMVPVIVTGWFGMVVLLIPIIVIESAILMSVGVGVWKSLLTMSMANGASTLAGFPLAIVLECLVMARLYQEDYPVEEVSEWKIPVVGVLLCVPFFLLSWWIEAPIVNLFIGEYPGSLVSHAVRDGNLVTYSILAILIGGLLTWAFCVRPQPDAQKHIIRPERDTQKHIIRPERDTQKHTDPTIYMNAQQAANWHAKVGIAKLVLAEIEIAKKTTVDDQLNRREVLTEGRAVEIGKTGDPHVHHGGPSEAEAILAEQKEDADLAA